MREFGLKACFNFQLSFVFSSLTGYYRHKAFEVVEAESCSQNLIRRLVLRQACQAYTAASWSFLTMTSS